MNHAEEAGTPQIYGRPLNIKYRGQKLTQKVQLPESSQAGVKGGALLPLLLLLSGIPP